jgi:hypothetical protein
MCSLFFTCLILCWLFLLWYCPTFVPFWTIFQYLFQRKDDIFGLFAVLRLSGAFTIIIHCTCSYVVIKGREGPEDTELLTVSVSECSLCLKSTRTVSPMLPVQEYNRGYLLMHLHLCCLWCLRLACNIILHLLLKHYWLFFYQDDTTFLKSIWHWCILLQYRVTVCRMLVQFFWDTPHAAWNIWISSSQLSLLCFQTGSSYRQSYGANLAAHLCLSSLFRYISSHKFMWVKPAKFTIVWGSRELLPPSLFLGR